MADPVVSKLVHDLRNPLNSIAMTAELAKLQLQKGESSEKVMRNLDTIVRICRECGARLEEVSAGRASTRPDLSEPDPPGPDASEDPVREGDGLRRVD